MEGDWIRGKVLTISGWLFDLLGIRAITDSIASVIPQRQTLRFLGCAIVADNPTSGTTDVTVSGNRIVSGQDALDVVYGTDTADVVYYSVLAHNRTALIANPLAGMPTKIRFVFGISGSAFNVELRKNTGGGTLPFGASSSMVLGSATGYNPFVDLQFISGAWKVTAASWVP